MQGGAVFPCEFLSRVSVISYQVARMAVHDAGRRMMQGGAVSPCEFLSRASVLSYQVASRAVHNAVRFMMQGRCSFSLLSSFPRVRSFVSGGKQGGS